MQNRLQQAGLPRYMEATEASRNKWKSKYMDEEDMKDLEKEKENLLKVLEKKRNELKAAEDRYEAVVPTLQAAEEDAKTLKALQLEHQRLQQKNKIQANALVEYEKVTKAHLDVSASDFIAICRLWRRQISFSMLRKSKKLLMSNCSNTCKSLQRRGI